MSNIRDQITALAAEWINPVYAARFDASHILKDLLAHAFLTGVPRHSDEGLLLLEANKRLQAGRLDGEYNKGDYFAPEKKCPEDCDHKYNTACALSCYDDNERYRNNNV